MQAIRRLRAVLHLPLLRAVAVGISLAASLCSGGATYLRIEHGVSLGAVVRYFSRSHLHEPDLSRLLRNWEVGLQLETLLELAETRRTGGLAYAHRDALVFHPYAGSDLQQGWLDEQENRALYARLVPLYHRAATGELVAALSSPELRAALAARGIDLAAVADLQARLATARSEEDEVRLLRRAARLIMPFTPRPLWPAWLGLGDRLRFYEATDPPGRFVGQFALLAPGWSLGFDEERARELGRRSHYLLIRRAGDRILLVDFYRGQVRRYGLRPFDHRTGNRLYQLTVAG